MSDKIQSAILVKTTFVPRKIEMFLTEDQFEPLQFIFV